jgi:hypothetical protein
MDIARRILPGRFLALLSSSSGTDALMRFLFQGCDHFVETLEISRLDATDNSALQDG